MWNPEKRPVSLDHEGSKVCGDPLKKVCLRTDGLKRALKSSANPARRLATRRPFGYIALRQRAGRPRRRFVSGEESPGSTELTVPGNARRRAIALATAALDAENELRVFQKFRELVADKMAVLISHRFSTVRMADRIFVIEDGHISEQGSHTELLTQGGTYARLFTLQAESYR